MSDDKTKADLGWRIARAAAKLAYIYESEQQKDEAIEDVFSAIEVLLDKNKQKWQRSQAQIFEVQAVEALTEIFRGIVSGEIFQEMTEEQIQMKIWQLRSYADDPDYHDYNEAIKWPLPTKEEIADKRGPKEFALWYWEDYRKSRTTILTYGRKMKSGELKFTPFRPVKTVFEREEYIASVCENLLQLKPEELKWMANGINELFQKE